MRRRMPMMLFCTDRGRHPRRDLYRVHDDGAHVRVAKRHYGPGATVGGRGARKPVYRPVHVGMSGGARHVSGRRLQRNVNLECKKCGRTPTIKTESFEKLLDSGLTEVDISNLPF